MTAGIMGYTYADLISVQNAIIALATGQRVVSVSIGIRTITYVQAQLSELRALRDEIAAELRASGGGSQFILTQTEKGL